MRNNFVKMLRENKSLKDWVDEYKAAITQKQQAMTDKVFKCSDLNYIGRFDELVGKLNETSEDGTLAEKVRFVLEVLNGSNAGEMQSSDDRFVLYKDVIQLMADTDENTKGKALGRFAYLKRIRDAVHKGLVRAKLNDRNEIKSVNMADMLNLLKYKFDYGDIQERPRRYISVHEAKIAWKRAEEQSPAIQQTPSIDAYWHRVRAKIKSGELPAIGKGRKTKVDKDALQKIIDRRLSDAVEGKIDNRLVALGLKNKESKFPEILRLVQDGFDVNEAIRSFGIGPKEAAGYKSAYNRRYKK